jgi:succinate dehydrogenase/fumarate reductase flavoprotein subunit
VRPAGLVGPGAVPLLQQAMTEHAGVLRAADGLEHAGKVLAGLAVDSDFTADARPCTESWEATNLLSVASALVAAAHARAETRGSHWRDDHRDPDPRWSGHLDTVLDATGVLQTTFGPLAGR